MMKVKKTEEVSRLYKVILASNFRNSNSLSVKAVWSDDESEWYVQGESCATYSQAELEEMLKIITSLNKENK